MRIIATVLVLSIVGSTGISAQETNDWRRVAEAIPLGSKVKVHTTDGKRISGTLMRVESAQVLIKRNTRIPEPAVTLSLDRVSNLERDHGGVGVGKAIAIGVASGAGMLLTLILFALQFD